MSSKYEAVIGLEIHVQLETKTKMFSSSPYNYGAEVNTLIDPVVLALPGTLPVLNYEAIEHCAKLGLMLGCEIAKECKWDRKNYFYPDSPKNYQLTQNDYPLCIGGSVEIEMPGSSRNIEGLHRNVALNRIHLEEDPGKLSHTNFDSLIDFNRAGVPLAEIVTEPNIYSSAEAVAFLNALRSLIVFSGVSSCDMEKGQMRCDANVSLRPSGSDNLGTRTEMKNLNSISNVKAAIEYEIVRQKKILDSNEKVIQETRRWDAQKNKSFSLRNKEEAHDYRYFPDPDLMPIEMDRERIKILEDSLPEKPFDLQRRYQKEFNLPYTITSVLCSDLSLCNFFENALERYNAPKQIANYIVNDLLRELSLSSKPGETKPQVDSKMIKPYFIAELVEVVDKGIISKQIAKELFVEIFQSGKSPLMIIEERNLQNTNNNENIDKYCADAIANNPKAVAQYKEGNEKAINALKGPIMKATKGKADPMILDEMLKKMIDDLK